ncbi:hypothetical protein V8F44DRAFT_487400 [Aspergillus fumigatus]|uniref:Uncharacterized protein n=1 Tax=Aspergillus fumigatus TaxID=746128 RepID=Q6MY40_ASPFM|nr:hypothetical protein AfA10A1.105 [Aspergillus fumigatus]
MTTPRNATREIAEEMAQLRNTMRQVASELRMNKALIQDAMARLEEMNNGHHVAPFCGLPTMHESDDAAEKLEKFLLTNPGHESLPSEDEDTDPDEVPPIYSREMKDPNLLEENWLDPVWIEGDGYSGKVPREIEEYLEFDCANLYSMIGSIKSIFWLFNHKELVKVVDDPACILEDEIIAIPRNINPMGFLMSYYSELEKMPLFIQQLYDCVRPHQSFHVAPAFHIPDAVTSEPSRLCIADIYRVSRPQAFPETVLCLKIKRQKNTDRMHVCPYIIDEFLHSNLSEWQHLTAHWLRIPLNGLKVPDNYKDADIIIGPLSVKQSEAKAKKHFPDQGEELQLVCTSSTLALGMLRGNQS